MNYINKLKHLERQEMTTNPARKPSPAQWLKAWRELATLTQGITQGDPRLDPVMRPWTLVILPISLMTGRGFKEQI